MIFTTSNSRSAANIRQRIATELQWLRENRGAIPMGCVPRGYRIRECMKALAWAHLLEREARLGPHLLEAFNLKHERHHNADVPAVTRTRGRSACGVVWLC